MKELWFYTQIPVSTQSKYTIAAIPYEPFTEAEIMSLKDKGARRTMRKLNRLMGYPMKPAKPRKAKGRGNE